ncbi:MAG TPA: hypothetical protein VFP11_02410, partial [Candidatus Angelobacter sp.]|nr:hypothetical protein [Candidatus Angelobacter sp.]
MTTLKVVFNGPFVVVREESRPNMITVFSPRDNQGLHRFYSNDLKEGKDQNVHITVAVDGRKPAANLPDLPIDPYFPPDFVANTEVWQRPPKGDPGKDYLVTIELPLPEKITYMSPLHPVTFEDGTQGYQATTLVLEYRITDFGKIHASDGSHSVSPLSTSDLQKKYNDLCEDPEIGKRYYEGCANVRNMLEQCAGAKTALFFFGVGISPEEMRKHPPGYADDHAVDFFNNVILQSFPKWTGKRLAPKGAYAPQGSGGSTAMLMETSFTPAAPRPQLRLVTAVIDCKAGNVI